MHTITNHYKDAQILNLGSEDERGPYLVTQTGIKPSDALLKTRMFVLRPDGYHYKPFARGLPNIKSAIVKIQEVKVAVQQRV